MATERKTPTPNRDLVWVGLGLLALVAVLALISYRSRPPQMGPSPEVFRAVDALFTAITARDPQLLTRCASELRRCRDADLLPARASGQLDAIIERARAGDWEPAAESLYRMMRAQRREGARTPASAVVARSDPQDSGGVR